MTTAERLELIRERMGKKPFPLAKPAGLFRASDPNAEPRNNRPKPPPAKGRGCYHRVGFGFIRDFRVRNGVTLEMPAKAAETFKNVIRREPHALTRIAEQLPATLPVLTFCPKTARQIEPSKNGNSVC